MSYITDPPPHRAHADHSSSPHERPQRAVDLFFESLSMRGCAADIACIFLGCDLCPPLEMALAEAMQSGEFKKLFQLRSFAMPAFRVAEYFPMLGA